MEGRPTQRCLTWDFSTAVANKAPGWLLVDRDDWEQRQVACFFLRRLLLLRCWQLIVALGYLQHILDAVVHKSITALGSHRWPRPHRSPRAQQQQQLQWQQCSQGDQHLSSTSSASASRVRAGRVQITATTGSGSASRENKGKSRPKIHFSGNNHISNTTVKNTGNGMSWLKRKL